MTMTRHGSTGTLERCKDSFVFTMRFDNGDTTSRILYHTDPNAILREIREFLSSRTFDSMYHVYRSMRPDMVDMLYYMLRYDQLDDWKQLIPEYMMFDREV